MPYSQALTSRVRKLLATLDVTEKEMFGGISFLLRGNMCVGVHGEDLIVRVEPAETQDLLKESGAKPFRLSGRGGMDGWLLVAPSGVKGEVPLKKWVGRGVEFASSLPPKKAKG